MSSSGSDDDEDEELGPNSGYYCVLNGSDVEDQSVHSVSPQPQTADASADVDEQEEDAKSVGADQVNISLVSEEYGSPMEVTVFHDQQSRSFAQHRSLNAAVLMRIKADMEANTLALLEQLSLSGKPTSTYLVSDTGIDGHRQRLPKSTPIRPLPFQSMPLQSHDHGDKTNHEQSFCGNSNFRHNATLPKPDWTEAKVEDNNDSAVLLPESTQLEIAYRRLINRQFHHLKQQQQQQQQQSDQYTSENDERRIQSMPIVGNHKNQEVDHGRLSPLVPQYSPISSTSSPIPPVLKSPTAAEPTNIPKHPPSSSSSSSRTSSFLPSNFAEQQMQQSDHQQQLPHHTYLTTELVRPSARYYAGNKDRTTGFSSRQSEPIDNRLLTDDRSNNNILQSAPIRSSSSARAVPMESFKQQQQFRAEIDGQRIREQQEQQEQPQLLGGRLERILMSNNSSSLQRQLQPHDQSLDLFQQIISHQSNQKPRRPSSSISLPSPTTAATTAVNPTTTSSDHLSHRSNTSQGQSVKVHGITVTDLRHLTPKTVPGTLQHNQHPRPACNQRSINTPSSVSIAYAHYNIVDLNGAQIPGLSLDLNPPVPGLNAPETRTPQRRQRAQYSPISPIVHHTHHHQQQPQNNANNVRLSEETDDIVFHPTYFASSPSSHSYHQASAATFRRSIPSLLPSDNDSQSWGKPRKGPRIHLPKTTESSSKSKNNNNKNSNHANDKLKSSNSTRRPSSTVSLPSPPAVSSSNELCHDSAQKAPIRPKTVAAFSKREKSSQIIAISSEEEQPKKPKETRKQKFSKDDLDDDSDDPSSSLKLLADTAEIAGKQERLLNKSLSTSSSSTKRSKKSANNKAQSESGGRKSAPSTIQQGGSHRSKLLEAISSNNSPKTTTKQQKPARATTPAITPAPSSAGAVDESSDIDAALGLDDEFYRKANEQDQEEYLDELPVCKWKGCELNGMPFPREKDYFDHLKLDHINNRPRFDCEWDGCERDGRPFRAKYMLDVHCRKHSGEKPYKCTLIIAETKKVCTKRYSRLENLRTHIRSHRNEKPFKCEYPGCEKSFSNNSDRAKHQNRTHSNHKSYVCEVENCDKAYTDPSSLRKHVKNTHGEEFYKPGAKRTKKDNNTASTSTTTASNKESKFKDPNETLPSVHHHHQHNNNSKRKDSKSNSKRTKNTCGPRPPASIQQHADDVEDGESVVSGSSSFVTKDYSSPSVASTTNESCGGESRPGGGGEAEEEDNSLILDVTGFDKVKILYKKSQNPLSREDETETPGAMKNQNLGKKKSKNVLLLIDQNDPKQKIPNISAEQIEEDREEEQEQEREDKEEAEESAIDDDVNEIDESIAVDEIDESTIGVDEIDDQHLAVGEDREEEQEQEQEDEEEAEESAIDDDVNEIDESTIVVDEIDDQHLAVGDQNYGRNMNDDDNNEDNTADSCADDSGLETMDTQVSSGKEQTDGDSQMDQTLPYTLMAENSHTRYHRLHNGRSKFCNSVPPLLDGDGSGAIRERHTVRLLENTRAQDERPSTAMNQKLIDRTPSANMTESMPRMDNISDATDCVHCGSQLTETELEVSKQKLCVSCLLDGHGIAGGGGGGGGSGQTLPYNDYNDKTNTTTTATIAEASRQITHSFNNLYANGSNISLALLQHQQQQQQQQQLLPRPNEHQYNHLHNRNLIFQQQPQQRQHTHTSTVQQAATSEPGGFLYQINNQAPRIYNNNTSTPNRTITTRRLLYPRSAGAGKGGGGGGGGGSVVRSLPPGGVNFAVTTTGSPADSNKTSDSSNQNNFSAYYHNLMMNSSSSTLHSAASSVDDHNNYCSDAGVVGGNRTTTTTETETGRGQAAAAVTRRRDSDSNDTVVLPDSLLEVDNLIQNAISEHHRRHNNNTYTGWF